MTTAPMIFADGILEASVAHGVARLTLAQNAADGKAVGVGQLTIPITQLPGFVNALAGLLKQVEARLREQQAQQPAATPANEAGAFRFS
jgi:hypothetical protein